MVEKNRTAEANLPTLEKEQFMLEKAVGLLLFSFRFSQGEPELQRNIFRYLHTIYPSVGINDATKEAITEKSIPIILKYLNHTPEKSITINPTPKILHSYLSPNTPEEKKVDTTDNTYLEGEAKDRINDMQQAFNSGLREKGILTLLIVRSIIQRDFYFLYEKGGRPRSNPDTSRVVSDSWLSHLCHYALNGNTTSSFEFDRMFKDVGNYLRQQGTSELSWEIDAKLDHVMRIHNEKHLQSPADLRKESLIAASRG